jgi:hypothetical protein
MLGAKNAIADPVQPNDFRRPFIEDFDGLVALGYPDPNGSFAGEDSFPTPVHFNGVTYTTDDGTFIYANLGRPECCLGAIGSFGAAIGTQTDTGYFDVRFDHPVPRAGGWVGVSAGPVFFFDRHDALIGAVRLSLSGNQLGMPFRPQFAGWADAERGIQRIRFTDAMPNGFVLALDRVTWDSASATPEPGTIALVALGAAAAFMRRRCPRVRQQRARATAAGRYRPDR